MSSDNRVDKPRYPPEVSPNLKNFYESLNDRYKKLKRELEDGDYNPADMGYPLSPSAEDEKEQKEPLLDPEALSLPEDLARPLLLNICEDLINLLPDEKEEEINDFMDKVELGSIDFDHLLAAYLREEKRENIPLEEELFSQIMLFTLRPFVSWMRENGEDFADIKERWREDICPLCGAVPELSRLTHEKGKRLLYCWLCGTEWRFNRFTCIYCGENLADGQQYFAVEDTPYRVDICDSCSRYLKVIDERRLPETEAGRLSWLVNDLGTQHLDKLAEEEGYIRR